MNIIQKPVAPGNFSVGRHGLKPVAIVIHIEDGTEAGTDAWFNDPSSHVSSHYSIAKTGEIHQYVKDRDTAFANGTVVEPTWSPIMQGGEYEHVNPNRVTLSIEHEGKSGETLTESQASSSAWLVERLCAIWGIPLDILHVIPHHAIRANKMCPGSGIDCAKIVKDSSAIRSIRTNPIPPQNLQA